MRFRYSMLRALSCIITIVVITYCAACAKKYRPSTRSVKHNNTGIVYMQQGKLDQAVLSFRAAIEFSPKYVEAYNNMGVVYLRKGDYITAKKAFNQAIEENSKYAQPYNNLGIVFFYEKKYSEASRHFRKAASLDENFPDPLYHIGNEYRLQAARVDTKIAQRELLETALKYYKQAIQIDENYFQAYSNAGLVYLDMGEFELALVNLKEAVDIRPKGAANYNNLGYAYLRQGDLINAEKFLTQALSIDAKFSKALVNMGELNIKKEGYSQAKNYFQLALNEDHSNPDIFFNLGLAFHLWGLQSGEIKQLNQALSNYSQALKFNPEHILARVYQAQLHIQMDQSDKAKINLDELLSLLKNKLKQQKLIGRAYYLRGAVFDNAGNRKKACSLYRAALESSDEPEAAWRRVASDSLRGGCR